MSITPRQTTTDDDSDTADVPIATRLDRWAASVEERTAKRNAWLAIQPPSIACSMHPQIACLLDRKKSGTDSAVYEPCALCEAERTEPGRRRVLRAAGFPANLVHASFDNWEPRNEIETQHLAAVRKFAEKSRRGFLLLLGALGTGKTHLAIAVGRVFLREENLDDDEFPRQPIFRSQAALLRELRASYHDRSDPIARAQRAPLLVIDDMGVSAGGKDEWPAISEILDHRYTANLPTVLTANLSPADLRDLLGDRLWDRFKESSSILIFSGPSHRGLTAPNTF
jgi:DNA replication protein DnaC